MPIPVKELVTLLDIGTSKVSVIIAKRPSLGKNVRHNKKAAGDTSDISSILAEYQYPEIIAAACCKSQGIKGGVIVSSKQLKEAISVAIHKAEKQAGITVSQVVISVSGGMPQSHYTMTRTQILSERVESRDLARLFSESRHQAANDINLNDRYVLNSFPLLYHLDNNEGIKNPLGMIGSNLTAEYHLVSVAKSFYRNLLSIVESCHLSVEDAIIAPYAAGQYALEIEEMEFGSLLLDIGGGVSSLALFAENSLCYLNSVAIGGEHITSDLALGLGIVPPNAERIKTLNGCVSSSISDEREKLHINLPQTKNWPAENLIIPRLDLISIIRPRVEEIIELLFDDFFSSKAGGYPVHHVVISGGTSQLNGIEDVVSNISGGMKARVAKTQLGDYIINNHRNPESRNALQNEVNFSTALGMLKYLDLNKEEIARRNNGAALLPENSTILKAWRWVKENF